MSFLFCEAILKVYNPYPSRVRGDKIQLKTNSSGTIAIDSLIGKINLHTSLYQVLYTSSKPLF